MNDDTPAPVKRKAGRPRLTAKQRHFARNYVETGVLSEAYKKSYDVSPTTKLQTIHSEASRTATIPQVKTEIDRLFAAHGFSVSNAVDTHTQNILQRDNLPTSQRALETYYEMIGLKQKAEQPTINVAFMINRANSTDGVEVAAVRARVVDESDLTVTHNVPPIIEQPNNGSVESSEGDEGVEV